MMDIASVIKIGFLSAMVLLLSNSEATLAGLERLNRLTIEEKESF